jgi:hypothetical protein
MRNPSLCEGTSGLAAPSTGTGADALFDGTGACLLIGVVFFEPGIGGDVGGESMSEACSISPVQPTRV